MPQLLPKGSFHWGNQQQKACPHWAMQHTVELKFITDQLLSKLACNSYVGTLKTFFFLKKAHSWDDINITIQKMESLNSITFGVKIIICPFVLLTLSNAAVGELCALHM